MDFSRESGMVLITTRFVWPYGGRAVYITGSFTGWMQWPMNPIEGCPTLFQTICSLPPGYHKYKFVVDGEWRHDEHQPFISSIMGTLNTIFLRRESDYLLPMLSLQRSPFGPTSGMDVDIEPEAYHRGVLLSAGTDTFPKISDADLKICRVRVTAFLSAHMSYELLPESGKVIALDVELPVKQAFHIIHDQGISMAPLWDFSEAKFVGVLSALDFILIMRELGSNASNLTEEELETHTISAWKDAKSHLNNQINGQGDGVFRQLIQAGPDDSLKEVALKILQKGISTVPIIHSPSEDASNPHLLHLASLSGILKCICRFFRHSPSSLPILQLPICACPVGTWDPKIGEPNLRPLAMLRPSASLSSALNLLIQAQVSSIPIVDENDSLLDVYSRSDITTLAKDKIYTHINLEETTIHQALLFRDDSFSTSGYNSNNNYQRCYMCLRSDPLLKVLEMLSQPGVRRVVIVEAVSNCVEGIVTLRDVFQLLLVAVDKPSCGKK